MEQSRTICVAILLTAVPDVHLTSEALLPRSWLSRLQRRLEAFALPKVQKSTHVRGVDRAVSYMLKGLLNSKLSVNWELYVAQEDLSRIHSWIDKNVSKSIAQTIKVQAYGGSPIAPAVKAEYQAILDLHGRPEFALRWRNQSSLARVPVLSVQHGIGNPEMMASVFAPIAAEASYAYDRLLCTSESIERVIRATLWSEMTDRRKIFAGQTAIVPLCVDTDVIRPTQKRTARETLALANDAVVLLYVGYLSLVKADLLPLLLVLKRIKSVDHVRKFKLLILGTGPKIYVETVRKQLRELALNQDVLLIESPFDDTRNIAFAAADMLIAPCESLDEAFGLVPVEAMAAGLPQVVADWNGYRETVVQGETGFLIATIWSNFWQGEDAVYRSLHWSEAHTILSQSVSFDQSEMVSRIQKLSTEPELRESFSERSRRRAESEYSLPVFAKRIYEQVVETLETADAGNVESAPGWGWANHYNKFVHFSTTILADSVELTLAQSSKESVNLALEAVRGSLGAC